MRRSPLARLDTQLALASAAAALVPMGLVAAGLVYTGTQVAEGHLTAQVERTAASHAAALDAFLERHRARVRTLDLERTDGTWLTAAVDTDPSVQALWFAGTSVSSDQPPSGWASEACEALVATPADVETRPGRAGVHEVVFAVQRGDQVLCGEVALSPARDLSLPADDLGPGGHAYLIDGDGVVVGHAAGDLDGRRPLGAVLDPLASQLASARTGWCGTLTTDGERRFAAFAAAESLPWGLWVELPASAAFAPFRGPLVRGAWGAGLLGLLAVLTAVLLARRLAAPVGALAAASGRVAQGELGAAVPVAGPAEIATLATEFNQMSAALARSHAELEDRVAARTRELAAARRFADQVLDTVPLRILVRDASLRVVRANAAALEADPDALGRGPSPDVPSAEVQDSGRARRLELTRARAGSTEHLDVQVVPLPADPGRPGVLEVAVDLTELHRIRDRLAQQEKHAATSTLAAGLAHEIGNPLASLSSELELLELRWDADAAREALPVLRDQVRRMSSLLRELVDVGRPASDTPSDFDVGALLEEIARLLRHDPRLGRVDVRVEAPAGLTAHSRRDRVVQVLVNLGLNALDALGGSGRLCLRAASDRGGLTLVVEDDGPGIPPELRSQVFDPFFTTKEPGQGTGLGLFVSARLVAQLGGELTLDDAPQGTRFVLTLPGGPA